MISSYPTTINNTAIPFPDSWKETPKKITKTFETEAGGIRKNKIRESRLAVSASFTVTDKWLKKFMQYRDADTLTVAIFNAKTTATAQHTMFINDESFTYDLIRESKYATGTNGLYKLSFDMEEF